MYQRTRKIDEQSSGAKIYWDFYNGSAQNNGIGPFTLASHQYQTEGLSSGEWRQMSDQPHPHYEKRRGKGEIIMGDMALLKESRAVIGTAELVVGPHSLWGMGKLTGDLTAIVERANPPHYNIDNFVNTMGDQAFAKCMAKLNGSNLVGGEAAHDLEATVSMLRRPMSSARDIVAKMRTYRKLHAGKTAASLFKATKDSWLEYRYGMQPIILDMDEIIGRAHTIRFQFERTNLVARSEVRMTYDNTKSFNAQGGLGIPALGNLKATGSTRLELTGRGCAGILYDISCRTAAEELEKMLGYRPRDLASTLLELMPYSYVFDWFTNVGNWLQAVVPDPSIHVKGKWVTKIKESTQTFYMGTLSNPITYPAQTTTVTYNCLYPMSIVKKTSVVRTTDPLLTLTPVATNVPLSLTHSLDAVALAGKYVLQGLRDLKH